MNYLINPKDIPMTNTEYLASIAKLNEWALAYYTYDNQMAMATDEEYDELNNAVKLFEDSNPTLISNESPTQRIGDVILDGFKKRKHLEKMYSLNDLFTLDEVIGWFKTLPENVKIKVEPKFDGVSLNLKYEDGKLVSATTRGDGIIGEDVTENAKHISNLPLEINTKSIIEIRGEVVILHEDFIKVNKYRVANGKEEFSNPRNGASGALRTLSSKDVKASRLYFVPYSVGKNEFDFVSQYEEFNFFIDNNFEFPRPIDAPLQHFVSTPKEVENIYNWTIIHRDEYPMMLDGLVLKVDDKSIQDELGFTNKFPRWAAAFKFPPEEKTTRILDVIFHVGKTGAVTPVAILHPVEIGGATISRVNLHNFEEIARKDIRIGDEVVVIRSGDVIPKLTTVFKDRRDGTQLKYVEPVSCPTCGSKLNSDATILKCSNDHCESKLQGRFEYAVGQKALNISALGSSTIKALLKNKFISDISDIYDLSIDDLLSLDGFKIRKATKIYNSIQSSIGTLDAHRVLNAIDIPLIGQSASEKIVLAFGIRAFTAGLTESELLSIDDIGLESAEQYLKFMDEYSSSLENLLRATNPIFKEPVDTTGNALDLKTIVITGTLSKSRGYFEELAKNAGAKVSKSVSKADYILAGEKAGSKLEKAKALNEKEDRIIILDEETFLNLL